MCGIERIKLFYGRLWCYLGYSIKINFYNYGFLLLYKYIKINEDKNNNLLLENFMCLVFMKVSILY